MKMETTPKLLQHVDRPFQATYSTTGNAPVRFEGSSSNIISVDGYRKVFVEVAGTSKTYAFSLNMGKLSGATLSEMVADNQPADGKIHGYNVKGPEIALWLKGMPNTTDQVQLWLYLRP